MNDNEHTATTGEESESTELCAQCGASIDTSEWHPVVAEDGDDGEFQLYPFCDETCREEWE